MFQILGKTKSNDFTKNFENFFFLWMTLPSQMVTEFLSKKRIPLVTIVTIGNGIMVRELYSSHSNHENIFPHSFIYF
jgi:phosphate starvation-inducible membrane PsiE